MLNKQAIIVRPSLGFPSFRKTIRAGEKSTTVQLFPKKELAESVKFRNRLNDLTSSFALPGLGIGEHVLNQSLIVQFNDAFGELRSEWVDYTKGWLEGYDGRVEEALYRYSDLFSVDDYPSREEVKGMLFMNLDYDLIVSPDMVNGHNLSEDVQGIVASQIYRQLTTLGIKLRREAAIKLLSAVESAISALTEPGRRLHDATVSGVSNTASRLMEVCPNPDDRLWQILEQASRVVYPIESIRSNTVTLSGWPVTGKH